MQDANGEQRESVVPREVLVQAMPAEADDVTKWLSSLRGAQVSLRVPQRGEKKALAETVERNAQEALKQHKVEANWGFNGAVGGIAGYSGSAVSGAGTAAD